MTENKSSEIYEVHSQSIKGRLEDEGIQARNLIKFNVPIYQRKKSQTTNDLKQNINTLKSDNETTSFQPKGCGDVSLPTGVLLTVLTDSMNDSKLCQKTSDYRARYWGQMMDTLKRTIDEIYSACETDESEVECKEVIMILEHSKKDFYSLIEKMNLFKEIENSTNENRFSSTNRVNKPVFIAWDERKISPGKPIMRQVLEKTKRTHSHSGQSSSTMSQTDLQTMSKEVPLSLDSGQVDSNTNTNCNVKLNSPSQTISELGSNCCTWADKVKNQIGSSKFDMKEHIKNPDGSIISNKIRRLMIKPIQKAASNNDQTKPPNNIKQQQQTTIQSIKSKIKTADMKKSMSNDNESDGEWEMVCRTKFSQRTNKPVNKPVHQNKVHTNPCYSERQNRKLLLTMSTNDKSENQFLKRNKSKSENNLRLSTISQEPNLNVKSDLKNTTCNVIKYYSSIVMSNESELLLDNLIFGEKHHQNCQKMPGDEIIRPISAMFYDVNNANAAISYLSTDAVSNNKANIQRKALSIPKSFPEFNRVGFPNDKNESGKHKKRGYCFQSNLEIDIGTNGNKDSTSNSGTREQSPVTSTENITESSLLLNTPLSVDNSIDEFGDDDETIQNIRQLNQKLADVENTETRLQNELGRAQEEEKACRKQIEQEEAELNIQSKHDLTQPLEISTVSCNVENSIIDEFDDGYDFVLNLDLDKLSSPVDNCNHSGDPTPNTRLLLPLEEIKNKIEIFPTDWNKGINEADDDDDFQDSVSKLRTPGRCVEMHQKLSAPSRKRSINSIQQLEKKQAKAKELRERLLFDRTEKVRELTKKVEEVRLHKAGLLDEKKVWMEQRLNKAETKRQQQLEDRIKKAHDEEMKGKEIAFIQSLEAAQKQHTILTKHQESEARLLERQEERKKRMEEKAEREVAAEIRRKTLESNRQAWINDLQLRWKTREEELAFKAENREKQRIIAVRAKEAEREQKKMVLELQQKTQIEQLKEKISKKHEDSERRHQEQLAEISRKAFEMSIAKYSLEDNADAPPIEPYLNKKWCNVCNIMIDNDVLLQSHLNGKKHRNTVMEQLSGENVEKDQFRLFNLEHIVDAPDDKTDPKLQAKRDRRKAVKKRIKKLKQRIVSNTVEFEKSCEQIHSDGIFPPTANKQKIAKFIKDIKRYVAIQDTGPWVSVRVSSLEKSLGDLLRCFNFKKTHNGGLNEKKQTVVTNQITMEQNTFLSLGGMNALGSIINLIQSHKSESSPILPEKTFKLVFKCVRKMCNSNHNICHYILFSTFIASLLDGLQTRLNCLVPDNFTHYLKSLYENRSSGCLPESRELPTNSVVEQTLLTLTAVFENFVANINLESAYVAYHHKCSASVTENNGRLSSLSNASSKFDSKTDSQKVQDIISYVVSTGTVDILSDYLCQVRGPLQNGSPTANFVLIILSFLSTLLKMLAIISGMTNIFSFKSQNASHKISTIDSSFSGTGDGDGFKSIADHTQLFQCIEGSEMCGLICLLYGILLYQGNVASKVDCLPQLTGLITISGLKLINNLAAVNLFIMQSVLSQEGTSLQLRHILSFLISYCNEHMTKSVSKGSSFSNCHNLDFSRSSSVTTDSESYSIQELLHEVILCVGYFCVNNCDNQNFVQTGQRPTILQQLCQLPFGYFSQKNLINCLYPTLICCCYKNAENTAILESEMTSGLLAAFIQEKIGEETDTQIKLHPSTNYDSRFEFIHRFPISNWKSAKNYFDR